MALGKPVVITEGTSTRGLITENEAEIVPCEDPNSLANAIRKLWEDKGYRDMLASRGRRYALSLEGKERLVKDLHDGIILPQNSPSRKGRINHMRLQLSKG